MCSNIVYKYYREIRAVDYSSGRESRYRKKYIYILIDGLLIIFFSFFFHSAFISNCNSLSLAHYSMLFFCIFYCLFCTYQRARSARRPLAICVPIIENHSISKVRSFTDDCNNYFYFYFFAV